ncbi:MAG: exonuclease domain-containing protein [Pyrinomonadaceae bacterium]
MKPYPTLISDSILITDTIALLHSFGGRVSAVNVVDYVMKIKKPEPNLARLLVSDLVERDSRLKLTEEMVELVCDPYGARRLTETEFVVFDLETTGAKSPPCRITEIGAYKVRGGLLLDEFHTLVNPETPIPPFIKSLTGISDEMVAEAPKFVEISSRLLDFIGSSVLVAHNSHFDMRFLNYEIGRVYTNYRVANPCLCTVQLSRKLLPHIQNHKLKTVAEYYSIPLVNHHRASDDARATVGIFLNLLEEMHTDGIRHLEEVKTLPARRYENVG